MPEIMLILKSIFILVSLGLILFYGLKLLQKYTKLGNITFKNNEDAVKLKSITYIDHNSKVVNLEFKNKSYILLLGSKNDLLIDSYEKNKIESS